MRGVVILMTALFALAPWYAIGVFMIEPLAEIARTANLAFINGQQTIDILLDVYFKWGPAVYIVGWFMWGVRYYASPERFVSTAGGPPL